MHGKKVRSYSKFIFISYNYLKFIFGKATQSCFRPSFVTPLIRLTADPLIINFGFDKEIPEELDVIITKYIVISIPSINSSLYTYSIGRTEDFPFRYNLFLNYQSEIKNRPNLELQIILSPILRANDSFILTNNNLQVQVLDYYHLSEETKQVVENSANVFKSTASGASFQIQSFFELPE